MSPRSVGLALSCSRLCLPSEAQRTCVISNRLSTALHWRTDVLLSSIHSSPVRRRFEVRARIWGSPLSPNRSGSGYASPYLSRLEALCLSWKLFCPIYGSPGSPCRSYRPELLHRVADRGSSYSTFRSFTNGSTEHFVEWRTKNSRNHNSAACHELHLGTVWFSRPIRHRYFTRK